MSESVPTNFIRQIIEDDLRSGRHQQVVTRFPPEPNGYLHVGHAKAICIAFGLAEQFGGRCNLRMDDTNPLTEKDEYVENICKDIRWLGFDWGEHLYSASDYFDQLYVWAKHLVSAGLAYVDEQSDEQIRATRGTVESPGSPSPWRDRPPAESLALLERMARGEFPDGAMVLRAKIDMGHPNMKMRDPLMYRIRNASHHNTGDRWHVYPLYDWAHGQSDAIEGVTHSTCSLEFDVNRELYDWYLDHLPIAELPGSSRPHQYEFGRMNLSYTITSKRKLIALVTEQRVAGWDDPRMPTLCGMRRRGIPPEAVRAMCDDVGVGRTNQLLDPVILDNAIRNALIAEAPRRMAVLDPIRLEIAGRDAAPEWIDAPDWPHDVPKEGSRRVPLGAVALIERDDFEIEPPKGFKRLAPGRTVRLRYGPVVTCTGHEVGADGRVTVVRCRQEPEGFDGKVSATIHWVDAALARDLEVRLYDRLFAVPEPGKDRDFREDLNPDSLKVLTAKAEPALADLEPGDRVQLERLGYFYAEPESWVPDAPALNRIVSLKDTWAKVQARTEAPAEAKAAKAEVVRTVRSLGAVGVALRDAGLSDDQAAVLEGDEALRAWYEQALAAGASPAAAAGLVVTELPRLGKERGGLDAVAFDGVALGRLASLMEAGAVTGAIAKQVLQVMAESGGDPAAIVAERGWSTITDAGAVDKMVDEVLQGHADRVEAYRGGRTGLLGFFVGQVMQRSGGRADPAQVKAALERALAGA
ncbi:MAG: glutamine--tRNA ligase/YqeY domain fusion protein [Myxococcota bacterium]